MNLHGVVSGLVGAVNPHVPATLQTSTGYTTADDGARTPTYASSNVLAQVQALTFRDIQQIDSLNLQGTRRAIYLSGDVEGIVRVSQKGGDLIQFANAASVPPALRGTTWLTAQVLETWGDGGTDAWCKVAVTLQNGS